MSDGLLVALQEMPMSYKSALLHVEVLQMQFTMHPTNKTVSFFHPVPIGCFKEESIKVLKNRSVMLCPDLGAFAAWKAKMPMLSSLKQPCMPPVANHTKSDMK